MKNSHALFAKNVAAEIPSNLTRLLRNPPTPPPVATGSLSFAHINNGADAHLKEVAHSMDLTLEVEQPKENVSELRELAKACRVIRLEKSRKLDIKKRVRRALRKAKEERPDELMRVHWMEKPLDRTRGQRRRALESYRGKF
ncbi:hypothetical protein P7C70_g8470, partial [Phenoliferia sp. Uapishka_3]